MWGMIVLVVFSVFIACIVYLVSRIRKYGFWWRAAEKNKPFSAGKKTMLSFLLLLVIFLLLAVSLGGLNAVICLIYEVLFLLICEMAEFIIRKAGKKTAACYYSGPVSIAFTALYMLYGWYSANHVSVTRYQLESTKLKGEVKIVQFADAHVGTTFDGKGLEKYIEQINSEKPDAVLITGDFIDDGTSEKDMKDACSALGKLRTEYGVFFSFGNHDKGYYGASRQSALTEEMRKNGVKVLEDECVCVDDRLIIIGRNDVSDNSRGQLRKDISGFSEIAGSGMYTVVMDHQPNDYANEADAKADLVLSGHTHGGQFFPVNRAGEWIGANDWTYGHTSRDNTDFIVTSGISDWEFIFKTGCHSEYNVITVKGK